MRRAALALAAEGLTKSAISRSLGISRAAIREWLEDPVGALVIRPASECFACAGEPCSRPQTYAYLLGQYLGDGYLVTSVRVPKLRIACADAYPATAAEVDAAMWQLSGNQPGAAAAIGCSDGYSYWMHWPCLFPQHGPGRKHERLGVAWRNNLPISISVAKRDAVALMDEHVGPKS